MKYYADLRAQLEGWLDKKLYLLAREEAYPVRLTQRRIFVLPTATGIALGGTLVVMLIASINYDLSLGYALTFTLGGSAVVSIVHAFRNLYGLQLEAGPSDPAFAGGRVKFRVAIVNPSTRPRLALLLRAGGSETRIVELPAAGRTLAELEFSAPRRGWQQIGRLILETRYPLGLIRAWSVFTPAHRALVFPRPETPTPPFPESPGQAHDMNLGRAHQGDDFAGLRNYRPSDSTRHIAWKVLARGGPMVTKEFAGGSGDRLDLDWDRLPPALATEARLSRLCAWLLAADAQDLPVGLHLPGLSLQLGNGSTHTANALRHLALFGEHP